MSIGHESPTIQMTGASKGVGDMNIKSRRGINKLNDTHDAFILIATETTLLC